MSFKDLETTNFDIIVKSEEKTQLKPRNELITKFPNIYKFCHNDINKFNLLLKKGVSPYEYLNSWKRFNETTISNKKAFYSKLY